jgi:hypothetical protein
VELDDGLLLLQAELAPLDVRPEVVGPPEPAALTASLQAWNMVTAEQKQSLCSMPHACPGLLIKTFSSQEEEEEWNVTYRPWRAASASIRGRAAQCRRAASGPPPASTAPS